ncbi:Myosin type-2 heavy chain 1, partial [Rhizoclosmatium sp. JEL0117]
STKYQFGKTKVFLKSGQIAFFEDRRKDRINHFARLLTKNAKRFIERKRFLMLKEATVAIQNASRMYLAKKKLGELKADAAATKEKRKREIRERKAATKIQSVWRGYRARKMYKQNYAHIVMLQSAIRTNAARKLLKSLKADAKNVEAVKEKAFSLEAKVVSLSQALRDKTMEAKELQEKCASYESHLASWKEKFEALDAKHKASLAENAALAKEIVDLKREQDIISSERDRFSHIVAQAVQDGLLPNVDAPALILTKGSIRAFSQSPYRTAPSMDRVPSREPPKTHPSRGKTLDTRGRPPVATVFPSIRASASPSNGMELSPAPPSFPGLQAALSPPSMARSATMNPSPDMSRTGSKRREQAAQRAAAAATAAATTTTTNDSPGMMKRPVRIPTMRSTSIFEETIVDDAERARRKEIVRQSSVSANVQSIFSPVMAADPMEDDDLAGGVMMASAPGSLLSRLSSSDAPKIHTSTFTSESTQTTPKVATQATVSPRTTSMLPNPKLMAARAELLTRPDFNDIICDNVIRNLAIPTVDPKLTLTRRQVLYPSFILNSLISMHLEQGMLVQLNNFVADICFDIASVVVDNPDKTLTAFWISNTHTLLQLVLNTQTREQKKPNNLASLTSLRAILAELQTLLETDLIPIYIKRLRDHTASLTIPAILENQDLPGLKIDASSTTSAFWSVFSKPSDSTNGLTKLRSFLTSTHTTLRQFFCHEALHTHAMTEIIRTIGVVAFNGMLVKRNFLNFKRETQDVAAVFELAYLLNRSQIEKLYSNYSTRDLDSPMSLEFYEEIRSRADPSRHRDLVPLSLDPEPDYGMLPVSPLADTTQYLPLPELTIPPEFFKLLP